MPSLRNQSRHRQRYDPERPDRPPGTAGWNRFTLTFDDGVHAGKVIEHRRPGGHCPPCGAEMAHGTIAGRSTWWRSREQA